jgi:aminoglycoside phosphotransferase (APT) family kinase protein
VVRVHPSGFQIFPEYDLHAQYAIMKALGDTNVPVPEMLWEEPSGEILGQPFYVMEKVDGIAPADHPPYTAEGWLKELSPEEQRVLWQDYLEALANIHRLDPRALGLEFLAKPELGRSPIDQELRYYEDYYRWAYDGREHPVVEPSLAWLKENRPTGPEELCLCWGDARIGNMIFRENRCVAVIDWEMARLGDPSMDLAWGLFLGRYHAEGNGHPPLPGFPSREETIAIYEDLVGRSAQDVEYYEVLAGMRFSVILIRLAKQLEHYELMPEGSGFQENNPVANLHRKQLEALGVL